MKRNRFVIIVLLVFVWTASAYAQKKTKEDKALEKEWKSKLKNMDALQLKALYDEKDVLAREKSDLATRITDLESQLQSKSSEVDRAQAQLREAEKKIADTESSANKNGMGAPMTANGVIFKVQVGAFKNKDLTKYFNNNKNFSGEVDSDGTKKYTIGFFPDYWEAENFKKYLREMGVKDAWIVAYKDGNRVEIREVLETAAAANAK